MVDRSRPIAAAFAACCLLCSTLAPDVGIAGPAETRLNHPYNALGYDARTGLQWALIWSGDYEGMVDGEIGPGTTAAIRRFQNRIGAPRTGVLTSPEIDRLIERATRQRDAVGFQVVKDRHAELKLGLPAKDVCFRERAKYGSSYRSSDDAVQIDTYRLADGRSLVEWYQRLTAPRPGRSVTYSTLKDDWFVVTGEDGDRIFYVKAQWGRADDDDSPEIRAFAVSFPIGRSERYRPVMVAMANTFTPFPPEDRSPAVVGTIPGSKPRNPGGAGGSPAAPSAGPATAMVSSGTGFVVSPMGHILTNHHVVDGCARVLVGGLGEARIAASNAADDLALLKLDGVAGLVPAQFSDREPRLGAEIIAFGYPLQSILENGLNVTVGHISSLSGLGGDGRYVQMTAAVQPGNSGGPLVDRTGAIVGVVAAKLDALRTAQVSGDIPQSINFAIKSRTAAAFLKQNSVWILLKPSDAPVRSIEDISTDAKNYTVFLTCTVSGAQQH